MAFDQVKMLQQLRKAQKQLGKEIIEVEAGDGAVIVQITGELKIKSAQGYEAVLARYRRLVKLLHLKRGRYHQTDQCALAP